MFFERLKSQLIPPKNQLILGAWSRELNDQSENGFGSHYVVLLGEKMEGGGTVSRPSRDGLTQNPFLFTARTDRPKAIPTEENFRS